MHLFFFLMLIATNCILISLNISKILGQNLETGRTRQLMHKLIKIVLNLHNKLFLVKN